jgi:hypothetical protein
LNEKGQPVNAIAVTSITNFILACEVFFLAGLSAQKPKARFSAAWFWSGMLILLGLATLIGGIDHGFFQNSGLPRYFIQRLTWIVLGAMTFFLLMTVAGQFFARRFRKMMLIFGIIQFVAGAIAVLLIENFLVVILNYTPVMLFLLIMNLVHMKENPGSRNLIAGILILFAASAVQRAGIDLFYPLDRNGLYHLVSMAGVVFMYRGGLHLRNAR